MSVSSRRARCAAGVMAGSAVFALAGVGVASAATKRIVRVSPLAHVGRISRVNPLVARTSPRNDTVTSSNWSGYAVQSATKFTGAEGSWTQPAVTCDSSTDQYAAFWAGIDGYASDSVEQLGTDSDCDGRSRPSYYAWYEMYPADSVDLSTKTYPVKAGDKMSASVTVSGSTYTLTESDATEGWTFTTTKTQSGLDDSSAELIAESPEICEGNRCSLAELSDFGTVDFTNAEAEVSGGSFEPYSSFTYDDGPHDIIAETSNGTVRAEPSALSSNAFTITWKHD